MNERTAFVWKRYTRKDGLQLVPSTENNSWQISAVLERSCQVRPRLITDSPPPNINGTWPDVRTSKRAGVLPRYPTTYRRRTDSHTDLNISMNISLVKMLFTGYWRGLGIDASSQLHISRGESGLSPSRTVLVPHLLIS